MIQIYWAEEIVSKFAEIINLYSLETDSNTPDFILAEYLWDCLMSDNILIGARSVWHNSTNSGQFPDLDRDTKMENKDGRND